ncbi:MAG: heavy-metal-associated domain-containing protein [Lewinellaceae bacterium]|nr:heavy-metal-associated domain-containing protein [Lewinellaceae bacterium]
MKKTFEVTGMTCNHCVHTVQRLLQTLDEVTEVRVSLEPPQATIEADKDYSLEELNAQLSENSNYRVEK